MSGRRPSKIEFSNPTTIHRGLKVPTEVGLGAGCALLVRNCRGASLHPSQVLACHKWCKAEAFSQSCPRKSFSPAWGAKGSVRPLASPLELEWVPAPAQLRSSFDPLPVAPG